MKRSHVLVEVAAMLSVVTVAGSGPVAAKDSRKGEVRYDESGKTLLRCPAETEGAFAIPDGVEIVEGEAFSGCSLIRSLTIPPSQSIFLSEWQPVKLYSPMLVTLRAKLM